MLARIVLTCAAVAALTAGCGGASSPTGSGTDVVAAFYPLAYAAEQIAGPGADVTNLTPPGAEPHDIELSPRDVQRVASADVVLYLGAGLMPQLQAAVAGKAGAVDLLQSVGTLPGAGGVDPHVWLDPVRYATLARRIGEALDAPDGARRFVARLRLLDDEMRAGLSQCARREIVTAHAAFGYLAARYGLTQVSLTGLAPEAEPAARDLERLVDEVQRSGATTVFTEPLVSSRIADAVAREAGVRTATLDPIEGLRAGALERGADYFSVMRENLAALREGLGCR